MLVSAERVAHRTTFCHIINLMLTELQPTPEELVELEAAVKDTFEQYRPTPRIIQ